MALVPKNIPTIGRVEKQIRCKRIAIAKNLSRFQELDAILDDCPECRVDPGKCRTNFFHFLVFVQAERHLKRATKERERLEKSEELHELLKLACTENVFW